MSAPTPGLGFGRPPTWATPLRSRQGSDAADIEPTRPVTATGSSTTPAGLHLRRLPGKFRRGRRPPPGPGREGDQPVTTRSGAGYWIFTTRGRVLPFGDARVYGDIDDVALNGPVLDSIPTPSASLLHGGLRRGDLRLRRCRFSGSMGGKRSTPRAVARPPSRTRGATGWCVGRRCVRLRRAVPGVDGQRSAQQAGDGHGAVRDGYLNGREDGGIFDSPPAFLGRSRSPPARPIVACGF